MKTYSKILATAMAFTFGGSVHAATLFEDDFEGHDINDQIVSQTPPTGEWGSTIVVDATAHTVQANPLGSGQVLRGQRLGTGGSTGYPTARTNTAPLADHVVTVSWDWYRTDQGSTAVVQPLYLGADFLINTTISVNAFSHVVRYNDNGSTINTTALSGFGGWERFEMVITFGPEDINGDTNATFDLYFERLDESNSQGVLAKTLIAEDVSVDNDAIASGVGNMRLIYGINQHAFSTTENPQDSTVYFDNFETSQTPIPEPSSLGLLAVGALLVSGVGRRRGA